MTIELYAPTGYWQATPEVLCAITNGCGTGGWKGYLVPDTCWGLCITECCNIHDWCYTVGSTQADKEEADRIFLNNLMRLIEGTGGFFMLKKLRRIRAKTYYNSVKYFGGAAFWHGKNPKNTLGRRSDLLLPGERGVAI